MSHLEVLRGGFHVPLVDVRVRYPDSQTRRSPLSGLRVPGVPGSKPPTRPPKARPSWRRRLAHRLPGGQKLAFCSAPQATRRYQGSQAQRPRDPQTRPAVPRCCHLQACTSFRDTHGLVTGLIQPQLGEGSLKASRTLLTLSEQQEADSCLSSVASACRREPSASIFATDVANCPG